MKLMVLTCTTRHVQKEARVEDDTIIAQANRTMPSGKRTKRA